jgi:hypothetical protein
MSQKKHFHILSELSAHPIARNIEWSDLISALPSIGLLHSESNGNYELSRNGHKIVFERSHDKVLAIADVIKLRHFLKLSAQSEERDPALVRSVVIAIDHHKALIFHNIGTDDASTETFHADLENGRILHKTKHHPPFNDSSPVDDTNYFDLVIKSMMKSEHIVILSHGTGSSSAAEVLVEMITKSHPNLLTKIIAIKKCDLEAMTEPQMIEMGTELLQVSTERIG